MSFSVFFFALAHLTAASSALDDSKTDNSYELSSSKFDPISLPDVRDRRLTNWEARAHSNFDDEDGNEDTEQTSFPSIFEESSSLPRIPENFNIPEKMTDLNFNTMRRALTDELSRVNRCIVEMFPRTQIIPKLLFSDKQRNVIESNSNLPPGVTKHAIPRYQPKNIQNLKIQEPIYVEEPGWILIEINRESDRSSMNNQDPFYLARGRRSFPVGSRKSEVGSKLTKINSLKDRLRKYLLEDKGRISTTTVETKQGRSYLQPRMKHSDILDILNEPFFISRGKKGFNSIDDYLTTLVNFETRRQVLDTWEPATKKNCSPDSDCYFVNSSSEESQKEALRARRGSVEDLLKSTDPFYLARGKRSVDFPSKEASTQDFRKISNEKLSSNTLVE